MTDRSGWRTAIAYGTSESVVLRGYDLRELVGRVSFAEAFLLLALGERPPQGAVRTLDAIMVSVIDHGIVPSSVVTRYLASAGSPLQAAVAGGIMSFGDVYGGAAQQLAEKLARHAARIEAGEATLPEAAAAIVEEFRREGAKVAGYGHPLHPEGDPRVPRLFAIAAENGVKGRHAALAEAVEAALAAAKKRSIPMNQDGAIAAIGLDLGFHWKLIRALAFVPRGAGLAVHALEEMLREPGWRHVPDAEVDYDGPALRPLEEKAP